MLAYSITGRGKDIVYLHGYLENKRVWESIANQLHARNVLIDLPGCGESPVLENQTIETMAEAVANTLLLIGLQKATFVAHSMGGYVALALAEKMPSLFNALVLLHSHPFADSEEKKTNRYKEIEIIKQGRKNLLLQSFVPKLYAPDFNDKNALSLSFEMANNTSEEGMIACLQAMAQRPDRSYLLHELNFPVIWIYGKHDQLFNYQMAEQFNTTNTNVKKVLLENTGHIGMFEQTNEVLKYIEPFTK